MTTPDHTLAARLAPCPFCGGQAEFSKGKTGDGKDWHYIECASCEAMGPRVQYADHNIAVKEALADAWSARSTAEADARVDAAVEACAVFLETHEVGLNVSKGYVVSPRNELSGGTHPGEAYAAAIRARGVRG